LRGQLRIGHDEATPHSRSILLRGTVTSLIRAVSALRQSKSGSAKAGSTGANGLVPPLEKEHRPMQNGTSEEARHREKMANRKAVQDAEVSSKNMEKGLLIVHTGKGKGKSTAAWGLLLRALGRGLRVGVVQFGKGAWETGERKAVEKFGDQVVWHTLGEGFTWETQDRARDVAAAERAWAVAMELMADPSFGLIILDELNIALRYDHLDLAMVVAALKEKRPNLHVVVTGRNAKAEMIEAADLVTEMTLVKHHFAAGVKAQEGIEF
jgi:cob(I)alamin adenosyltransferase